jgi:TRAP-type C4-dicarboxylate transport system permease small subunit
MALAAGLALVVAACFTTYEVVLRKVGYPTTWALEYSIYLVIWVAFIGFGYSQAQKAHIEVDMLRFRMPRVVIALKRLALALLTLVTATLLTSYSLPWVLDSYQTHEAANTLMRTPTWLIKLSLPIGSAILAFRAAIDTVEALLLVFLPGESPKQVEHAHPEEEPA